MLFADLSGFTQLSERLSRAGRAGTEELTDTLNRCFADLLADAYASQGSLLKFGGDALLLLFDGDGHAQRACESALRMQALIRRNGRVATSVGAARLRISIGVHSGVVDLYRVGRLHKELVVTGPAATAVVELEAIASASEVVVSRDTAALVDRRLIGAERDGGFLLRRIALPPSAGDPMRAKRTAVDVSGSLSRAVRDHILNGGVESEHRPAVVAFVKFPAAPDETALDDLISTVQAAAVDHDVTFLGTDVDRGGGKCILVAGAPIARGDEGGRMLRAARQISNAAPGLRIGVNAGRVFAGEVGPPYRRTYTVMGDVVNVAARLMAAAAPGQVLASPAVVAGSSTEFELVELEPLTLKGKAHPVPAFAVGDAIGRRVDVVTRGSFVGRAAERAALGEAFERVARGTGSLVEISGDAGIGKSRLLEEVERTSTVRVFRAFCEPYEAATPYFAFRFLLRGLFGIGDAGDAAATVAKDAPALAPWFPLLADVLAYDVPDTPETGALEMRFRRERTRWAVTELLRTTRTSRPPAVLVIEDAQWLDGLSADLLLSIAGESSDLGLLVCLVRQTIPGGYRLPADFDAVRIELRPLEHGDAAALVAGASARPLRPEERDRLVDGGGGNPLFLQELLRTGKPDEIPESLEALIAIEIDRLPADLRRVLRYAAVLGATFEIPVLRDLLGDEAPAVDDRLDPFVDAIGPDLLRFRNQCYRQVAYDNLPFRRRTELHARAADAIARSSSGASPERAAVLSLHSLHARRHDDCWRYALAGASHARAKYANHEAAELLERALSVAPAVRGLDPGHIAQVFEDLGHAYLDAGVFDRARAAYRRARRGHAGDAVKVAHFYLLDARLAAREGQLTSGIRALRRGIRLLDGLDDAKANATRAHLGVALAQTYQQRGRLRDALRLASDAVKDAQASDDRLARASSLAVLDTTYIAMGRTELATHCREALDIWEQVGDLSSQAWIFTVLGAVAYYEGRWDDAVDLSTKGSDAYRKAGNVADAAYGTCNVGDILIDQGRFAEAEPGLIEVLDLWTAVGLPAGIAAALCNLGRIALRRGQLDEASRLLADAASMGETVGPASALEADSWMVECLLARGEPQAALERVDAMTHQEAAAALIPRLKRLRGCALVQLGNLREAEADLDEGLRVARAHGALYETALLLDTLAALRGEADPERDQIFRQLGVVTPPRPAVAPLTAAASRSVGASATALDDQSVSRRDDRESSST